MFADGGRVSGGQGTATISSFGGGIRVNALGFPIELAAIRALDGPKPVRICLLGRGNVGAAFAELLAERAEAV